MNETALKIKTPDRHIIYGTLRKAKGRARSLIVFVHGLPGNQNERLFYNGARFFAQRGFDTFRLDLYSGDKGGRVLTHCTLATHARDLNAVVRHFQKTHTHIFTVGHSLGGPSILLSDTRALAGIILWDPAKLQRNKKEFSWLRFHKKMNAYIIRWGTEILMSKKMVEEWLALKPEVLEKIKTPIVALMAGKGMLIKPWKKYVSSAKTHIPMHIIPGAGHTFDEDGTEERLFHATWQWLRRV